MVWQEAVLLTLLILAMISMGFDRGFQDPAVSLWMVMLGVQSLPYRRHHGDGADFGALQPDDRHISGGRAPRCPGGGKIEPPENWSQGKGKFKV